ncbi:MAG: PEP/pyruvate-binding domain-containing protein, partial [Sulfolobales archaeon]
MGQTIKKSFVVDISAVNKSMIEEVGGKGANLGELVSIGIRVPPGFIITSDAFKYFLEYNNLIERISKLLNEVKDFEEISNEIKKLIINSKIPPDLEEQILKKYEELEKIVGKNVLVAVRSSATAEDIQEASFAGQQDTYLNVDKKDLLESIKKVWASLYNARALAYRAAKGIEHTKVLMAVIVQKMVNARSAGVLFTLHPANGDRNVIVIESSWGLGEAVVSGKVTPDEIVVDKKSLKILEKKISNKKLKIIYDKNEKKNKIIETTQDEAERASISDEEAIELAKYGIRIEGHYKVPMDIEWAIDQDLPYPDNIFIVQARPETFWSSKSKEEKKETKIPVERKVLARGLPASPGIAFGKAKVLLDVRDAKDFNKGDILITKMTDPDWVPIMKIASAIVTD